MLLIPEVAKKFCSAERTLSEERVLRYSHYVSPFQPTRCVPLHSYLFQFHPRLSNTLFATPANPANPGLPSTHFSVPVVTCPVQPVFAFPLLSIALLPLPALPVRSEPVTYSPFQNDAVRANPASPLRLLRSLPLPSSRYSTFLSLPIYPTPLHSGLSSPALCEPLPSNTIQSLPATQGSLLRIAFADFTAEPRYRYLL